MRLRITRITRATWGPPPRALVVASAVVLGISVALAILGALRTGVSTDEPVHVMRLNNFLDNGWYALDWDYGGSGPGSDGTNTFVYGPVAMLLVHAWSVLCGAESWGEVSSSAHAYDVRHLGIVLYGLVCLGAVTVIGRVLLRHWRWGLVAAAALAAIPMWTGHTMVNVKDVPVATGHTLVTLALLLFVRDRLPGTGLRLARAGCLVAGLVLTVGTRPGMWAGISVMLVVAGAGIIVSTTQRRGIAVTELLTACAVSAAALVAIYPNVFGSPLRMITKSTETSSNFRDGAPPDRMYVPRHLAEEMPTLLLLFMLTGAVVAVLVLITRRRQEPVPAARIALVGAQAFTLPLVAILSGSDLYHGLRQLLFAIPAMAVLSAYGMAWWLDRPQLRTRRFVAVAAVGALVLPAADQITLQPYQTTYVNLATDLVVGPATAADHRPGTDSWRLTLSELIDGQDLGAQLLCKTAVDKQTRVSYSFYPFISEGEEYSTRRSVDCREEPTGPLAPDRLPIDRAGDDHHFDAVFLKRLPANCTPVNQVSRRRHGFEVVLTTLGRCAVEPPTLTAAGISASSRAFATGTSRDIWRFAVDGWVQWPNRAELNAPVPQAEIAFLANHACRRDGCTLVVEGRAPDGLVVRLGDSVLPAHREPDGTVRVPVTAAQASARGGVWLTFTRRGGGTLAMRLTGLSLKPMEGNR